MLHRLFQRFCPSALVLSVLCLAGCAAREPLPAPNLAFVFPVTSHGPYGRTLEEALAVLAPSLKEKMNLRSGSTELPVEIEFASEPPAGALDGLPLQREGHLAWGTLQADTIRSIATVPQVRAIRDSQRPLPNKS